MHSEHSGGSGRTVSAMVRPNASWTPSEAAEGLKSNCRKLTRAKPAMRADRLEIAFSCSALSSTSRLQRQRQSVVQAVVGGG
jgi:hypothetical protein